MTEQVRDRVVYQDIEYTLDEVDGEGLFDPSDLGVRPALTSTANWRGFHCKYAVDESRLVLAELRIGLEQPGELHLRAPEVFTAEPEAASMQSWLFKNLRYPIAFTGHLVLVKDWIEGYFTRSSGIRPIWTWGSVLELRFREGLLVETDDRSDEMRDLRERRETSRLAGSLANWRQRHAGVTETREARDQLKQLLCANEARIRPALKAVDGLTDRQMTKLRKDHPELDAPEGVDVRFATELLDAACDPEEVDGWTIADPDDRLNVLRRIVEYATYAGWSGGTRRRRAR